MKAIRNALLLTNYNAPCPDRMREGQEGNLLERPRTRSWGSVRAYLFCCRFIGSNDDYLLVSYRLSIEYNFNRVEK